ncbi:MAG: amidohydrolase family protein [Verrucomicrobia bacterium]|nr:amidohydrolase family protein [Verrucomicrobiota bacterium]
MSTFNRRSFLKTAGTTLATLAMHQQLPALSPMESINNIVDCHFHLWAKDKKRFPYQPNPRYAPDYVSTAEEWDRDRVDAGISKGIFVSGAPYGDDPSFLYHSLKQAPDTLRGICLINPNVPEGVKQLEETVSGHNIVGVRLQTSWLWGVDWASPYLAAFWKRMGELNLVVQMHLEPEWNPQLDKMITRFPNTRVVIDHLGRPRNGTAVDFMLLQNIAKRPNAFIKLSSFDTESREEPPYLKVQPVVKELVEWFTPKRCVWGCNNYRGDMGSEGYLELVHHARRIFDFLNIDEQKQIFCKTPHRLYNLT